MMRSNKRKSVLVIILPFFKYHMVNNGVKKSRTDYFNKFYNLSYNNNLTNVFKN